MTPSDADADADEEPEDEALFDALFAGDATRVRASLAGGASPDATTLRRPPDIPSARWADRASALVVAAAQGDLASMAALLDAGASPEARIWHLASSPMSDYDYEEAWGNALTTACAEGQADAVDLLLSRGARRRKGGFRGSAMELAVRYGHLEVARTLVRHGIAPGKRFTRLAIARGDVATAQVLCDAGGLPRAEAVAYAQKKKKPEVAAALAGGADE